ncbi:MAG: LPS export ABC transporter periplasmic protein LptC [Acidobacteriota bacterium]|nr:LPS export ABC transporter periplasmic protein LptC [Acidobacteriota bacterium]
MRGTRWLLLAAILLILCGTAVTYFFQRRSVKKGSAPVPAAIAPNTNVTAQDWEWSRADNGRTLVRIRAHVFRQVADTGRIELEDVRLELYQRNKDLYDLVKSPKADFNQSEGKLFSNGQVEIILNVPAGQEPSPKLTSIKSSGVTFESKTGKASTDRPTSFRFESGDGTCTGAEYDPTTRELHLRKDVLLNMHSSDPKAKPMHVETPDLVYKEASAAVWLTPSAKMTRGDTVIDAAGASLITLKDGAITAIDAQKAHGIDSYPKRKLDYAADAVHIDYNDQGAISKVLGMGNAHMNSVSDVSDTSLTGDSVSLDFTEQDGESVLTHTTGNGHSVIESKPLPDPAKKTKSPETRILRSPYVDLYMRAGGREIDKVQTQAPGTLEFLPNAPDEHRRLLNGERMTIVYGAKNQIQSFVSNNVTTETFPTQLEQAKAAKTSKAAPPPSSKTASINIAAGFDAAGKMTSMKQWDHFTYEEGDRRARAATATLDNDKNLMDLDQGARIWDATGSTDSDHIRIDQKSGNYIADGHVSSSRLPDPPDAKSDPKKAQKKAATPGLLDETQPTQGTADHMTSANRNKLLHYEGNAVLWQASDRIQADKIDIDREKQILKASGNVITQLLDKKDDGKDEKAKENSAPSFTIVKAQSLVYTDADRLAHYMGGAEMNRPGLNVKGREIRAYLKEDKKDTKGKPATPTAGDEDSGSRLEKAYSDGDVEIVETTPNRKRTGTGNHAEYYTADERIIVRGNDARLVDSLKGASEGAELTYFTDEDKLVVTAAPKKQVKTKLRRKK